MWLGITVQMNPNRAAFAAVRNLRARQMNPNNPIFAGKAKAQHSNVIDPVQAKPEAAKAQLSPAQAKK